MYFIRNEEDLWEKEIVFTDFARFADAMVIITRDKGICVIDKDDEEIEIYNPIMARDYILNHDYIRKELNRLGVITKEDIDKYKQEQEEKRKQEYQQYLRLKEKYGKVDDG